MSRELFGRRRGAALLATVALLLAALPAGAFQRGEREPRLRVEGRVRNVGADSTRFTLESSRGTYEVRYVGPRAGFGVRLPSLRNGDEVEVTGAVIRGILEAETVRLRNRDDQATDRVIEGRVTETNRGRFFMQADHGERVRVDYDNRTAIRGLGSRGRSDEIRNGDRVRVEGRWQGDRRIRARRVDVTSTHLHGWRSGDRGEITEVGRQHRYLRVRFQDRVWRVFVEEAVIRDDNGRRIRVGDLRKGEQVEIHGAIRGDEIRAQRVEVVDPRGRPTRR